MKEQDQREVQKMINVVQMRDEINKTIIECQNLLSEKKLPVWYRKDMIEYTKLLASQLSLSGSQKQESYVYSYLQRNAEKLRFDIETTSEENAIIRIP